MAESSLSDQLAAKFAAGTLHPNEPVLKEAFVLIEREVEYNDEYYELRGANPVGVFFDKAVVQKKCKLKNLAVDDEYTDYDGDKLELFEWYQVPVNPK